MEVNKKARKFLDDLIEENKNKLLGIAFDISYFKFLVVDMDENKLRADLDAEKAKYEPNNKGVPKFTGDKDKIAEFEAKINKIGEIKIKITNLETIYKDISKYINFMKGLDEETAKRLNAVHDTFGN